MSTRRPRVMGIVNVTPDSFSDGGLYADPEPAVDHGRRLLADGADLLDIGGESTRPGAIRPVAGEELDRVIPVITRLAAEGAVVSVDTMRASVAAAALAAGAQVVNDVSGGLADPEILEVVAQSDATYVAMHWRAHATAMQGFTDYGPDGVVEGVRRELGERLDAIVAAGIDPDRVLLDPGLGFAKTPTAQLGAAARAGVTRVARAPAADRGQPQVLPGISAGRRRQATGGGGAGVRPRGARRPAGAARGRLPAGARRPRHV